MINHDTRIRIPARRGGRSRERRERSSARLRALLGRCSRILAVLATSVVVAGQASAAATPTAALAFTSYRDGVSSVYVTNADGTGQQRLTATARPAFEGQPAYSPDGGRIAYVCGNFELCVMNADGSGQQRLTTNNWP